MNITIEMIEKVLDETNADYKVVKQALLDADGNVDEAIAAVKEKLKADAEASEEAAADATEEAAVDAEAAREDQSGSEEKKEKPDWSTDEYADDMVERLKNKIREGNVNQIRISRDDKTILSIPVNIGILGGIVGLAVFPWAMILGVIAAYGLDCKVEIIKEDGSSEEL